MNILVTTGSFKDVYNSMESCTLINNIIGKKHNVTTAPMCDGGEYTYDTLKYYFECIEETVANVLNSYEKYVTSRYLVLNDTAYIISSEIIRLLPCEDGYKNPLELTDYGLGQVVLDAIKKGYKKINLCLGGTSTVCCGMGFAQALGTEFYDKNGKIIDDVIKGKNLIEINKIIFDKNLYKDIELKILNDGLTGCCDMETVSRMKIGSKYKPQETAILEKLSEGISNISKITGLAQSTCFSGCAGAVFFGINILFNAEFLEGGKFFSKLFGIDEKIKNSDIVITGEGRFDNLKWEKTPITIAKIAKKYSKKLIFVCGQLDKNQFKTDNNGVSKDDVKLKEIGIDILITCQDYYDNIELSSDYCKNIELYKKNTPIIFEEKFKDIGLL